MEKRHILCSVMLLLSMSSAFGLSSVIEHRSQSSNNARKVAGEFGYVHLRDQDEWYTRSASTIEYQRTFRSDRLARSLFGCFVDDCGNLLVQGSQVEDRNENALMAENFYLPSDFSSVISVKPVISDIIFDYNLYVGFNFKCLKDAYFRVYAPLVRSKWCLNMDECLVTRGENDYPAGYFMPCAVDRDALNEDFCSYLRGGAPAQICATIMNQSCDPLAVGDELASTVFNGLKYYNGDCNCCNTATTLADLRMELGWNFWNYECYHLGVNMQAAFPTGTRPDAQYMFNPVVGNGKHWEFGGGVTGHYIFWECGDFEKSFGINLDANLTYLFDNHEQRTFDLRGKELSRFMLAAREGDRVAVVGALAGGDDVNNVVVPCGQFKYEYTPVANLTTLDIKVKSALQADVALWLNYTNRNLSVDLGYNLWARSHDEIEVRQDCDNCPTLCNDENRDLWVLKGTAQMYGFVRTEDIDCDAIPAGECNPNFAIPLSQSQSGATINASGALDNAQLAFGNLQGNELLPFPGGRTQLDTTPQGGTQIATSISPVYFNCEDIDLCQRNTGISNKVWANIQWTWDLDRDCNPIRCKPFLGLGGEAEFGVTRGCDDCTTDCGDCCTSSSSSCFNPCSSSSSCSPCGDVKTARVAASQWGVWLKGGMNFE